MGLFQGIKHSKQRESQSYCCSYGTTQEKGVYTGRSSSTCRREVVIARVALMSVVKDLFNETQAGHYISSLEDLRLSYLSIA